VFCGETGEALGVGAVTGDGAAALGVGEGSDGGDAFGCAGVVFG